MTNGNGGGGTGGGQPGSAGSNNSGCAYETALVNSRRRIPYSVGSESLTVVHPGGYHARLEDKDERCLSVDIMDLYHVFSPPFIGDLG
jgi:DNA polymerase sigma